MKYRTIIRPEAENDLREAFDWYEDKRLGLGYDFLLQVEAGLRFIESDPYIFPPVYKDTRKHIIKRFPYKIIYIVKDDIIIILAVLHGMRDPNLFKKKSDNI